MTYGYEQVKTKLINAYTNIFTQMFNPAAGMSPDKILFILRYILEEDDPIISTHEIKIIRSKRAYYEEPEQILIDDVPRIVNEHLWAKKYSHLVS